MLKIEIDDDTMDAIVVERLKEYRTNFEKWDGVDAKDGKIAIDGWAKLSHHDVTDIVKQLEQVGGSMPFVCDLKVENKYRKKMRKSIDMVLGFCEG
tara:strand:- start:135 stop:422 length:288 start_codon:yes stop_codon:yes gene_type:complete